MQPKNSKMLLIEDLRTNIFCRLMPSPIHGIGVFAIRDIPVGCRPFHDYATGDFVEVDAKEIFDDPKIPESVKDMVGDFYVEKDGILYLHPDGLNAISIAYFLNDSKTPNMKAVGEECDFEAIRDIKAGEELTSEYSAYSD